MFYCTWCTKCHLEHIFFVQMLLWSRRAIFVRSSKCLLKVSKFQKHFFWNSIAQKTKTILDKILPDGARAEFGQIFRSFFGQWSFKKKCFWDLLTFRIIVFKNIFEIKFPLHTWRKFHCAVLLLIQRRQNDSRYSVATSCTAPSDSYYPCLAELQEGSTFDQKMLLSFLAPASTVCFPTKILSRIVSHFSKEVSYAVYKRFWVSVYRGVFWACQGWNEGKILIQIYLFWAKILPRLLL